MQRRFLLTAAMLVVAFVAGGALASAQSVTAEIGFPFVAGGKDMPAGKYTVEASAGGPVILRGSTGSSGVMPIVTTLGRHDKDMDPEFVFDKLDGKMVLSEIWMPGKDGFLVLATAKPHEHAIVGGSNPKK